MRHLLSALVLGASLVSFAFSQRVELVLEAGERRPNLGIVTGFGMAAINDSGNWVAQVFGSQGSGIAVDGVLAFSNTVGTLPRMTGLGMNSQGAVAYSVAEDLVSGAAMDAVFVNGRAVVSAGDPTGDPGVAWQTMTVWGISGRGRVVFSGEVLDGATSEVLDAFGWVDVDPLTGNVMGRGLFALEGEMLPAGLGEFGGPVRNATVSESGSVLWTSKRVGVPFAVDEFLLLDQTLLATEGSPSPNGGLPWRLANADLALSPSATHWAISGVISGDNSTPRPSAVVVDGQLRYGPGDLLPDLAPAPLAGGDSAVVSDADRVTWKATAAESDRGARLMLDGQEIFRPAEDEVAGQGHGFSRFSGSPSGRYTLAFLQGDGFLVLARVDAFGTALGCGSISDPFEPNDTCTMASFVDLDAYFPLDYLPTATASVRDDDWYELPLGADDVLTLQARHTAVNGDVDLEVFDGACGGNLLGRTNQAAEDEGLYIENTTGAATTVFVRVFVPDRSLSDCVEYRLRARRGAPSTCSMGGGPAPDYLEPNSSCRAPAPVVEGFYPSLNVSQLDPDYYAVTVPAGSSVTYTAEGTAFSSLLTLSLQRADCSGYRIDTQIGEPVSITLDNPGPEPAEAILRVGLSQSLGLLCREYTLTVDQPGDSIGTVTCFGVPNSTGQAAQLAVVGSTDVTQNQLELRALWLPVGAAGYFLASTQGDLVVNAGGSQGNLCLGGEIGRVLDSLAPASQNGQAAYLLDLTAIPQPTGPASALPGSTWHFQGWYRDANPASTSNFTWAIAVTFQ